MTGGAAGADIGGGAEGVETGGGGELAGGVRGPTDNAGAAASSGSSTVTSYVFPSTVTRSFLIMAIVVIRQSYRILCDWKICVRPSSAQTFRWGTGVVT